MYTYTWYHWITFFFLYCFFGWIFESTYVSLKEHRFVNRGFLRLPMLPLYGTGAVMMLWVCLPFQNQPIYEYFAGVIAATALEYITGAVMEMLFKVRYWDYSNHKFNLHGYICLSSSIAWGFLTIFMTDVIHRPIAHFVESWSPYVELSFILIVGTMFTYDSIQSTKAALNLGKLLESMTKMKADLEELEVQMSLLRGDATQHVADLKDNAVARAAEIREIAAIKATELKADNLKKLSDRATVLRERRVTLTNHLSKYHRALLAGNPSAYSAKFADALQELRKKLW